MLEFNSFLHDHNTQEFNSFLHDLCDISQYLFHWTIWWISGQCSQITKPHLGRRSCCTASTNTLGRLYDGTRFLKRKQNEKMVILGMRGGPGSWIGQDYRGVYWRYWVGSGEPPAETTETKRKGGGKKGEKRAREKKSENEPKEEGWGEKWTSQIQSGTTYHNNNCSHSILFFLVFSRLIPQYFWPFINLEQVSKKWLFSLLHSEHRLVGAMKLLPNKFPISEANSTAATRIYTLLQCFIKWSKREIFCKLFYIYFENFAMSFCSAGEAQFVWGRSSNWTFLSRQNLCLLST